MAGPSRVRGRVLAFTFALTVVTYLDRVCVSAAAPAIMKELHISVLQMGAVFSAFTLAYSIFEVPSGWLGDVRGPRRVLTRIVLWWSAFTMLTGAAQGFQSLVAIRFLFGVGEAGAFPNIIRSFARWFPRRERGRASGIMFLGSRVGGMLSAPLALLLIARLGWRLSFVVFGAIGLVWAAAWARWYRDRPAEHPGVNAEELAWIEQDGGAGDTVTAATPWRQLLTSRNVWAICAMYSAYGYGLYFYLTWLPTYLVSELGFSALGSGFFASLPFLLAGIADVTGGWLTDRLARQYRSARGALWPGLRRVCHDRRPPVCLNDHAGPDVEGAVAGAGAGLGGSVAERVLGGAARRRGRARRRDYRVHEHVRQSRRVAVSARGRVGSRAAALVDAALLHHRGRVHGGRHRVAGDRSGTSHRCRAGAVRPEGQSRTSDVFTRS